MKNKGWIFLLFGAGVAYLLYQRTVKAGEMSQAQQKQYLDDLRTAAMLQQKNEASRNAAAGRVGVVEVGAPSVSAVISPAAIPFIPQSTKYGPQMDPR